VFKPIFCLMGPTASGKTDMACELFEQLPLEIVSVDSVMLYRELNIGSAKPNVAFLARFPHHLINLIDPPEHYSAAQFCEAAHTLCQAIFARGRYPLLVGGTMMYFKALQQGLAELPEADATLRQEILAQAKAHGWDYLHAELMKVDPLTASRVHSHDKQRIQRALEVYRLTKQPLSEIHKQQRSESSHLFINFSLIPENRSWLHERIAIRFQHMLDEGLVAEVDALQKKWTLTAESPSMRCVGYRQVLAYLQGEYGYADMCAKGAAATRQLAKRQLTWLRHWPDMQSFHAEDRASTQSILAIMRRILDNS